VTLIAAFRCTSVFDGKPAVVICADSQETVGGVKVSVNKILPGQVGEYGVAIAGSGNGDLIDAFSDSLMREIRSWPPVLGEDTARGLLRGVLLDFHRNEVESYPAATPDDKLNHLLVCITSKYTAESFLWELRGSAIVPVKDYALLGIGEAIYHHELKKLHTANISDQQAAVLGIHLISLAKATSNYVGGETQVAHLNQRGAFIVSQGFVAETEQLLEEFNKRLAACVLTFPDFSVNIESFRGLLDEFREGVINLRGLYVLRMGLTSLRDVWKKEGNEEGAKLAQERLDRVNAELSEAKFKRKALPSNPETSEDRQSPCTEGSQETDRTSSDD
jgi:hypothetical protein